MKLLAKDLLALPQIANDLLTFANEEKIYLFEGEMAAGKTTFIKAFCANLGILETVSSPTYSIVNEYQAEHNKVFHFDFYRIKNEAEAFDIGFEEYLYSGAICLIEWPEMVSSLLPDHFIKITVEMAKDETRIFTFSKS